MTEETIGWWLSLAAVLFGIPLMMMAMAMVGRKVTDLEYQIAAELDGVRRIQAVVNIRTHTLRVLLGLAFAVAGMMTLANAPSFWSSLVSGVLLVGVLSGYMVAAVLDWLDDQKQVRILLDQEIAEHAAHGGGLP